MMKYPDDHRVKSFYLLLHKTLYRPVVFTILSATLDYPSIAMHNHTSYRHYLLFFATSAMNPRFMSTVDENLNPVSASVR